MSGRPLASFLTYAVASAGERRAALAAAFALIVMAILAVPYGALQLGEPDALLPTLTTAGMVAMLVSAAMLRGHFHNTRFAPLALLSLTYSIPAVILLPYILSFPHVFSPTGFGLGAQTAPWLWIAAHVWFVALMAGYVWSDSYCARASLDVAASCTLARRYAVVTIGLASVTTVGIIVSHDRLPMLVDATGYTGLYRILVDQLLLSSAAVVLATLIARSALRSTTHLWIAVVLAAFGIDVFVNGQSVAHFSVAWYVGFVAATAWQMSFLIIQLRDSNQQLAAIAADTQTLQEETQRDALTGLYNRRGYDERIGTARREARAAGASFALLVVDVDYFKRFNDHFGHLAGDEALRAIAGAMLEVVNRPTDAVCRVGGDEFVVVLGSTDEAGANVVAERIRSRIARLRIRNAPDVPLDMLSVSIGITGSLGTSTDSATLIYDRADQALYRAKKLGRNRVGGGGLPGGEPAPVRDVNLRIV